MNTQQNDIWKRDLDLIREILFQLERGELDKLNLEASHNKKIANHFRILIEAGMMHGEANMLGGGRFLIVAGPLTWNGYELLDSIRPAEVYDKIQAGAKRVGAWGLPIIQNLAVEFLKSMITAKP